MSIFGLLRKKEKNFENVNDNIIDNFTIMSSDNRHDKSKKIIFDVNKELQESSIQSNLTKEKEMQQLNSKQPQMRQFDILVIEDDEDGKRQKQVSGVFASSPEELQMLYSADGAKIKILKEYAIPSYSNPSMQNVVKMPNSSIDATQVNLSSQDAQPKVMLPSVISSTINPNANNSTTVITATTIQPPKYFEIGGIKCKLENGKMYQEQWVVVDASKYRILSNSTNKVVSLNGKHIETLKWVLIEDESNNGVEKENA